MEKKQIKIIFAGRLDSGRNTLSYLYFLENGERVVFSKKILDVSIGFKIDCVDEGNGCYSGFKRTLEITTDQSFIDKHIARDKAVFELFRVKKESKKIPTNEYDEIIQRLNDLTRGLTRSEKKVLINKILFEML